MAKYKTFIVIVIATTLYHERGSGLWASKTCRIVMPSRFSRFMAQKHFKELRKHIPFIMSEPDQKTITPRWKINKFVSDFVTNRNRIITASHWKVLDELMSPYHPQKQKTGNLPHILYLICKPQPHGTEFKCTMCTDTGCMLAIECQERKDAMQEVRAMPMFCLYNNGLMLVSFLEEKIFKGVGCHCCLHPPSCGNGIYSWATCP